MTKHPLRTALVVLGIVLMALGVVLLITVDVLVMRVLGAVVFFAGIGCVMFALGRPGRESLQRYQGRDWKK
jgi:uncharacterized membrane protein HdeD (DUF308 family)